jgi:Tfp pilus assembly protein PilN
MRAVNLLPKDDGRRSGDGAPVAVLVGVSATVFVCSVLTAGMLFEKGKVKKAEAELHLVQQQLAAIPAPPPARSATEEQLATQQDARLTALATALSRRVAWDRVLREISLVLPDDVWVTEMKTKSPAPAASVDPIRLATPAAAAEGLIITGRTYSNSSVARFLSRLQVVPELTNVQLQDTNVLRANVVQFTVAADVRMSGGGS